jgi:hypothetical protein
MTIVSVFIKTIAACLLFFSVTATSDESHTQGKFSEGDLAGWEEKSFEGFSQYRFVETDKGKVLHASTNGKASGLFKEVPVDLTKTPWINWSWKIENTFKGNNERSKEGDDYAARIYVVVSGGIFFWNTKALNYVWASHEPQGSTWPNAYTENARMLAVRTGDAQIGMWTNEKRNVREDLQSIFGEDITRIDVIAVMVDGDNTGQSATSYFGDIFFSEK